MDAPKLKSEASSLKPKKTYATIYNMTHKHSNEVTITTFQHENFDFIAINKKKFESKTQIIITLINHWGQSLLTETYYDDDDVQKLQS